MSKNTPYLKHTTFYERGVAWAQRKKREVEVGLAALYGCTLLYGWHFSRYFAVKTPIYDSQYISCNQSDTRE